MCVTGYSFLFPRTGPLRIVGRVQFASTAQTILKITAPSSVESIHANSTLKVLNLGCGNQEDSGAFRI